MTLEEFRLLPMQYKFGYSADDHALRQYVNEEYGIARQLYTPRNPDTCEWGKGENSFMLLATNEEFDTVGELYTAFIAAASLERQE
jgi:hypothetical protein